MTRWLQAVKMASRVVDTTDITDTTLTGGYPISGEKQPHGLHVETAEVLSVVSVMSKGGTSDFRDGEDSKSSSSLIDHEALQIAFEERAAILEFDAGYSRQEAERRAHLEIYRSAQGLGEV